jgi:hypothetical protein
MSDDIEGFHPSHDHATEAWVISLVRLVRQSLEEQIDQKVDKADWEEALKALTEELNRKADATALDTERTRIDDLATKLADALNRITTLEGDLRQAEGDIATERGRITTLEGDLQQAEGDIATERGRITTIDGTLTATRLAVQDINDTDLPRLNTATVGLTADIQLARKDLSYRVQGVDKTLSQRIDGQQDSIDDLEREIGLRTDVDELLKMPTTDLPELISYLGEANNLLDKPGLELSEKQAAALTSPLGMARRLMLEYRFADAPQRREQTRLLLADVSGKALAVRARSTAYRPRP